MSETYDVAVIGGGPSGSYAAFLLASAGTGVAVIERKDGVVGAPCCTGVVGTGYADLVGVEPDCVVADAGSAVFISPSGRRLRVESPVSQALVLDRALLERRLLERAAGAGAHIRTGTVVLRIDRRDGGFELLLAGPASREVMHARALVIAGGVGPGLTRQIGLGATQRYLVGAHAEIEMDDVSETEIYLLQDLARGLFAWLVPVGGHLVRIGVLGPRAAKAQVGRFLERPEVRRRLRKREIRISQRPVPVTPLRRTYADGLIVIGDAAGQVKPTTGGGLYFGAIAARAGADVVGQALAAGDLSSKVLSGYERRWKSDFASELRRGSRVRRIYGHLSPSQVDMVIDWAARRHIADELLESPSFSFDWHSRTLMSGLIKGLLGPLARPCLPRGGGSA